MYFDGIFVEFEMKFFDGFVGWLPDDRRDSFVGEIFRDFCVVGGCHSGDASLAVRLAAMREKGCVSWVVTND